MKKLYFIKNESGHIFPLTLFVATIVLVILSSLLIIYKNERYETKLFEEQLYVNYLLYAVKEQVAQLEDEKQIQLRDKKIVFNDSVAYFHQEEAGHIIIRIETEKMSQSYILKD
ncbi:MAG TPA: hypothetical protein VK075_05865 [Pseudogracilibacillus sp.]|nr:hypothetical protein [Pseudogracilibacillus sp.]